MSARDLRGFTCAISSAPAAAGPAGITAGIDGDGPNAAIAVALRHADGTRLVAYLTVEQLGRFAERLETLIDLLAPGAAADSMPKVLH